MDSEKQDFNLMQHVIERCQKDTAFRAALKKANNPDTEYLCWEYLADYNVELDKTYKRLPYVTVFAAAAKSGVQCEGSESVGYALRLAYDNDVTSEPARAKLRRLLACSSIEELCSILHPLLNFIGSRTSVISYSKLLSDLIRFNYNAEYVKAEWAQSFFGKTESKEDDE